MYRALLEHLSSCETLLYYSDPSEEWIYNQHIPGLTIVRKRVSLENFLATNGGPHTLVSWCHRSVEHQISKSSNQCALHQIARTKTVRRPYYNLFEQHGVMNTLTPFNN